jgi:hypothetical protein
VQTQRAGWQGGRCWQKNAAEKNFQVFAGGESITECVMWIASPPVSVITVPFASDVSSEVESIPMSVPLNRWMMRWRDTTGSYRSLQMLGMTNGKPLWLSTEGTCRSLFLSTCR